MRRDHRDMLLKEIVSQLVEIYGSPAAKPLTCFYQDWAREPYTATIYDQPPMHEHPIYHPPAGKTSIWEGRIHFAGTETAAENGGYLEGALTAAKRAALG